MGTNSKEVKPLAFLIQEQRDAAAESTVTARVAGCLIISARLQQRLQRITNDQIGQVLVDFVWSEMDKLSPEAVITAEAICRLTGASNGLLPAQQEADSSAESYQSAGPTKLGSLERP